jgi:competence protein ComEC
MDTGPTMACMNGKVVSPLLRLVHPGALVVATCWAVQQIPALPSRGLCLIVLLLGGCLLLVSLIGLGGRSMLLVASVLVAGGWATLRAHDALALRLPEAMNGRDIEVVGVVGSMSQAFERGVRFRLLVERCIDASPDCPANRTMIVSWYSGFGGKQQLELPAIRPGQRWHLALRVKQPRANLNPGLFDAELRALQDGISASGHVRVSNLRRAAQADRDDLPNRLIQENAGGWSTQIERLRDLLRERMRGAMRSPGGPASGVLVALVIGDQAAISAPWWEIFNRTGIGHLMSISGLHITMLAGLTGWFAGRVWRSQRLAALMGRAALSAWVPAPYARWVFGLIAAFAYSALAGWGIPAQRTCWMLAVAGLAMLTGRGRDAVSVICSAGAVVCIMDPWAPMAAGFWLSFAAVSAIIWFGAANRVATDHADQPASKMSMQRKPLAMTVARLRSVLSVWRSTLHAALRTQYAATLVLLPLGVLFFANVSLVSPLANAFAIPLVSMLITPLAMMASVLLVLHIDGGQYLLAGAHLLTESLLGALEWLDRSGSGAIAVPLPGTPTLLLATCACALLLAPIPMPGRALSAFALLPLLLGQPEQPAAGELHLTALDIGQGTAVLIEAGGRRLLYDTGPRLGPDTDAGLRVILPYLRSRGIRRLDAMVVSHQDLDHSGGALTVLRNLPVDWVASSLRPEHSIVQQARRHYPCQRGQGWQWGDTRFRWLHPGEMKLESRRISSNAKSCVLRIENPAGVVLLAGDIERRQESGLLELFGQEQLRADVLLAPHHGSRTSSSEAFLDAVNPGFAIFQIGFRNRYHHPNALVLDRYRKRAIRILRSDDHAAIRIQMRVGRTPMVSLFRRDDRRYWRIRTALPVSETVD